MTRYVTVGIDASAAVRGGGATYLNNMLPELCARDDVSVRALLVREDSVVDVPEELKSCTLSCRSRLGALSPEWTKAITGERVDVMLAPTEISLRRYDVPLVLGIRNVKLFADHVDEGLRARCGAWVRRGLARWSGRAAVRHIAASEFARDVAVEGLYLEPSGVAVVYHGVRRPDAERCLRNEGGDGTRHLLFVSTVRPHKGLLTLLDALTGVEGSWRLSVAGAFPTKKARDQALNRIEQLGIGDRVVLFGNLPRGRLDELYCEADCLVFPSLSESFGFPLVEASKAGMVVIAPDTEVAVEILGEAGEYYSPWSGDSLTSALQRAVDGKLVPGPLPRDYAWEECAEATVDVLRRAARE